MAAQDSLTKIKETLDGYIGEKIKLKANRGRKKTIIKEGVLENTYPAIFIVKVEEPSYTQRFTFNYADVLTRTVELTVGNDKKIENAVE